MLVLAIRAAAPPSHRSASPAVCRLLLFLVIPVDRSGPLGGLPGFGAVAVLAGFRVMLVIGGEAG